MNYDEYKTQTQKVDLVKNIYDKVKDINLNNLQVLLIQHNWVNNQKFDGVE